MKILAFAGSLREGSWNKKLLKLAAEVLTNMGHEVEIYDLAPLPLINEDLEVNGPPPTVAPFRDAVERADAVLIATPENNHSVPAVTKNAVDWLSRSPRNLLKGKVVAMIGATIGHFGTVNAQRELRWILARLEAFAVPAPWLLVTYAVKAFDENGRLVEERYTKTLDKLMATFVDFAQKLA